MIELPFTKKRALKGLKELTVFGKTVHRSQIPWINAGQGTDVGRTVGKVKNRAYRNFWICRGSFGKTCGLKPKVVY
jgi:hypothetical protein